MNTPTVNTVTTVNTSSTVIRAGVIDYSCVDLDLLVEIIKREGLNLVAITRIERFKYDKLVTKMADLGLRGGRFKETLAKPYGEMIFTSFPLKNTAYSRFRRTEQERALTIYELKLGETNLSVAATEFESDARGFALRRVQIADTAKLFESVDNVILLCKTNILKWQESTLFVPPEFSDAWSEKGTSENEATSGDDRIEQIWYKGKCECQSFGAESHAIWANFTI